MNPEETVFTPEEFQMQIESAIKSLGVDPAQASAVADFAKQHYVQYGQAAVEGAMELLSQNSFCCFDKMSYENALTTVIKAKEAGITTHQLIADAKLLMQGDPGQDVPQPSEN